MAADLQPHPQPSPPGSTSADAELRRMMDRLIAAERMAFVGQATAQVAAHLTNQLSILPLIQIMEREYQDDVQLAEFLSLFRESYHQIAELVQQIRRIVRFESMDAPPSRVAIAESIRELSAFLRHQKSFPWNRLRLDLREDAAVLSSRLKLHHILVSLLYNAADAIAECEDGRIWIRTGCDAEFAWIEVSDNGRGIPESQLPHIWDASYSTKAGTAHGLGLCLVKRLMAGDGGQITCRSNPASETVFTIRMPLAPTTLKERDESDWNGMGRSNSALRAEDVTLCSS